MKKVLSITLSLIIIVTACLGFGTVALANNYSSAQAIQEELNKNKFNSSTPLTVTVTGTYNLSEYNIAGSKAYNKKVPAKVTLTERTTKVNFFLLCNKKILRNFLLHK